MKSHRAASFSSAHKDVCNHGVAVVVPFYDAKDTLPATLNSALEQEGVEEIIAIDDGSQDNSLELARSFEPRVRVLTGSHHGVSAARNRGIEESTAQWLLFLDSDDLLVPGTLAERLEI